MIDGRAVRDLENAAARIFLDRWHEVALKGACLFVFLKLEDFKLVIGWTSHDKVKLRDQTETFNFRHVLVAGVQQASLLLQIPELQQTVLRAWY